MGHGMLAPPANPTFLESHTGTTPCQANPELFVCVDDRGPSRRARAREAAALCQDCPLLRECGDWGRRHQQSGVWGGVDYQHGKLYKGSS